MHKADFGDNRKVGSDWAGVAPGRENVPDFKRGRVGRTRSGPCNLKPRLVHIHLRSGVYRGSGGLSRSSAIWAGVRRVKCCSFSVPLVWYSYSVSNR